MSEKIAAQPRRHKWLRLLGLFAGVLLVLVVVLYFVATSGAFLKGFILPKVSQAMNANVTVTDASISPFSEVILKGLKVESPGQEPLVTAAEVRLKYSLMDILGGKINVELVSVSSPVVSQVINPDGSSNLDPLLKSQPGQPAKEAKPEPKPAKASKPLQLDLKKFALTDATVRRTTLHEGGKRDTVEVTHLSVTVDNLKNAQTGKLEFTADVGMDKRSPVPGEAGTLQAQLKGDFSLGLAADLMPAAVRGNTRVEVKSATGPLAQAAGLNTTFDCDLSSTEIKQLALRLQKADLPLGEILVSGPFDLNKIEGRLALKVQNIDRRLLNLAGAAAGLDFGPTTINSTTAIQVANAGALVNVDGQFNLNQFQAARTNQVTPPMDLQAAYAVALDRGAGKLTVSKLALTATQKGKPLLNSQLSSPLTLPLNGTAKGMGDAAFGLTLTNLDLADWNPFIGQYVQSGNVGARLQLLAKNGIESLGFTANAEIQNLTAGTGSNQITQATVVMALRGEAATGSEATPNKPDEVKTTLKKLQLPECSLRLSRLDTTLVQVTASGTYDHQPDAADFQLSSQVALPPLLQAFPRPGLSVTSGSADLKARLAQQGVNRAITGNFVLAKLTAQSGSNVFRDFGATADLDVALTPEQAQIRKISGKITEAQQPGGSFDLAGSYGLSNKAMQLTARLSDFNQNGLRAFLEPALGGQKLVSLAINGLSTVQSDPKGDLGIQADLQVTNLVVAAPPQLAPTAPIEAKLQVDTRLTNTNQVADIRQCVVTLNPTPLAPTNQVQLAGKVDLTDTNGMQGGLKLSANTLDVTRFYDVFMGGSRPAAPAATPGSAPGTTPPAPAGAPGGPEKEPPARTLPFRNFTTEAAINRFYLRELEITNLLASTRLDGGAVVVKPLQLALNGAPVKGLVDVNLGVPGYRYEVNFSAVEVPFAPLFNTFQPDRKGQLGGTITAVGDINGAGTTGASLQTNLAASFDIASTNLNLSLDDLRSPLLKTVINVIAIFPTLVKNPSAGLTALAGSLFGGGSAQGGSGGWGDEFKKSPIDVIQAKGAIAKGSGLVNLDKALIQSRAFQAGAHGTIKLNEVLTNSVLDIPLAVSIQRSLAESINMVPAGTPTNAVYVQLPDYVTVKGTLGVPEKKINTAALAGTALKSIGGSLGGDKKTGNLLQELGNRLTAPKTAGTNASAATGASAPATNAPATNAPATNPNPVGDLLNQLLKPKKK